MDIQKVVVIGGGYAGIQAVKKLANRKNIEITLIDKNGYHYLQTEVYDFIANKSNLSDITIDLVSLLHGVDKKIAFFNAVVEKIDSKNSKVLTNKGEIDYDYLIIATGAQTNLPKSIDGIEQYSHGVKSLNHAIEFKQKFENLLYYHIKNNDCKELNVVVGGGGLSGIEIATEMAYIKNIYLETIGSKCDGISIYVIDGGSTVLKQFSETVIKATQKRLEKLKIFLKLGVYIQKVDEDTIFLSDNRTLKYNFMIFTGGIFANSLKFDQFDQSIKGNRSKRV